MHSDEVTVGVIDEIVNYLKTLKEAADKLGVDVRATEYMGTEGKASLDDAVLCSVRAWVRQAIDTIECAAQDVRHHSTRWSEKSTIENSTKWVERDDGTFNFVPI